MMIGASFRSSYSKAIGVFISVADVGIRSSFLLLVKCLKLILFILFLVKFWISLFVELACSLFRRLVLIFDAAAQEEQSYSKFPQDAAICASRCSSQLHQDGELPCCVLLDVLEMWILSKPLVQFTHPGLLECLLLLAPFCSYSAWQSLAKLITRKMW